MDNFIGETPLLDVKPEVAQAVAEGMGVVALESTIISHGMPYPQNVETALKVERLIRDKGALPATIAVIKGRLKAGLTTEEIEYLGKAGAAVTKCSRRDLPFVTARGGDGATTVAGTMIVAAMAGIRHFATGGIGGVHRGAAQSFDISADLQELAHTPVAVYCAGAKSILDLDLTMEYLETFGVPVIGYGVDELPAFYTRSSGINLPYRCDTSREIARVLQAQKNLGYRGGAVIANPIPREFEADPGMIQNAVDSALREMEEKGIRGKDSTPFLLEKIADITEGKSLDSNIELVFNNAQLAAETAVEMAARPSDLK